MFGPAMQSYKVPVAEHFLLRLSFASSPWSMRIDPEMSIDGIENVAYMKSGDAAVFQIAGWLAQSFCNVDLLV